MHIHIQGFPYWTIGGGVPTCRKFDPKTVFGFGKGSNDQNHSSLGSLHPVKKFAPV